MKGYHEKENAADRETYVGDIFRIGEKDRKKEVLKKLDLLNPLYSKLHNEGLIHIHDLDAYGATYNCLALNILNKFPYSKFNQSDAIIKIQAVFDHLREILTKLGNEQSGGMSFANFDLDIAKILIILEIELNDLNKRVIKSGISSLIRWCNDSHDRMGRVSYYVTLNIGLADTSYSRFIAESVLDSFFEAGKLVYKPNIVFKVKSGLNLEPKTPNHYLYLKALKITSRKMIPTYLLCDSIPNKEVTPYELSIMGCRTRVVSDFYGENTSIGRGNICNISINLPGIALRIDKDNNEKLDSFKTAWREIAESVVQILLNRYHTLNNEKKPEDFLLNYEFNLWQKNFSEAKSLEEIFKHGTLSIGFIGLDDAIKILFGKSYFEDEKLYNYAKEFVLYMRGYVDNLRDVQKLNWSLLATSGELISGRFPTKDKENGYINEVQDKEYYTNSFHIPVDSHLSAFNKIKYEGPFHAMCNGGCITYVELGEAPLDNSEALDELIKCAIESGTSYLGFNFPLDICNDCGSSGIFDECPKCKSKKITRLRRVSGYLEVLDYFTSGKKNEEKNRRKNSCTLQ